MNQELQALLAHLDNATLRMLYCFWDNPLEIKFDIGVSESYQVRLFKETEDLYYLIVSDNISRTINFDVPINSNEFQECQRIYQFIRGLSNDKTYQSSIENNEQLGIMLQNVENIVKPILDRMHPQN